jgi:uncharacterized protein (TIGR03083 family)
MTETDPSAPRPLIDAWSASASAVLDLVETLTDDDVGQPTDLPGWTVRDIVAHLAHLESELAGDEPVLADESEIPPDARDDAFRAYTERGVAARRSRSVEQLAAELRSAVDRLRTTLDTDDPPAPPAGFPRPGRSWEPLLRDRTFDYWMHEQDIRRATGRAGGWGSPGAMLSIATLRGAVPYVVGKKVRPPAGSTIAITIEGDDWADTITVRVGDDGRAREVDANADAPDAGLTMTVEDFVLAGGGRRDPGTLEVEVTGDTDLARRVLDALAVTP